jgi:hypothetical protein
VPAARAPPCGRRLPAPWKRGVSDIQSPGAFE